MADKNLLGDLEHRGLVADMTAGLKEALESGKELTVYFGVDPTSDSLHLGNFLGVLMLERFRLAGHRSIALVGGATGMVGDPSGRSKERNLLDEETLEHNFQSVKSQMQDLTEISDNDFVDNRQWWSEMSVLDFLRDVGKHATVNQMVAKESVKTRMEGTEGLSFTEFSYMLIQANDFFWLNENMECNLQIGGSDQWGNITAGVDLIRRRSANQAYGLTWHLVERSDGQKFGKTAEGTIWLDAEKTSPFDLYQYLINLDDETSCQLLYWLTLIPSEKLDEIVASHKKSPESRQAQQHLAEWVTSFVHGAQAAEEAQGSSQAVFSSKGVATAEEIEALRGSMPETSISIDETKTPEALIELLVKTELCSSKSDARRQLKQGAISVNGETIDSSDLTSAEPLEGKYFLLGRGKKKKHLLVLK